MAVCVNCKKEISFLNATRPLWEGTKEQFCSKCWSKIDGAFLNHPQEKDIDRFIKVGFTEDGLKYLREYCAYAQSKVKAEEQYNGHMLTTGYNFEGYQIEKYITVVSGSAVLGTGLFSGMTTADFSGAFSDELAAKLEMAKDAAMRKMIEKSAGLGGNAVIGIDFDYMQISTLIGVVANGTSVYIKPLSKI